MSLSSGERPRTATPDLTSVVLPHVGAQDPHEQVVLHTLAKPRNECISPWNSHGEFLWLKGTSWSVRPRYPLKGYEDYAISGKGAPPAKWVREFAC